MLADLNQHGEGAAALSQEWRRLLYEMVQTRFYSMIKAEAETTGLNVPEGAGGWWHEYGCTRHGVELVYDSRQLYKHRCPVDGELLSGDNLDGAWRVFRHNELGELIYSSAALYSVSGDQQAGAVGRRLLLSYAEKYEHYDGDQDAPEQRRFLTGKLFRQALSESIWAVRVLSAYELLRQGQLLNKADCQLIEAKLFGPQARRLARAHQEQTLERGEPFHNYIAWLNAALGIYGLLFADQTMLERALYGPFGFWRYLSKAINPDGMEYEASAYYHLFSTRACLLLAQCAKNYGLDLWAVRGEQGQSLDKMVEVLLLLGGSGNYPVIKDGPYERLPYRRELQEVGELALAQTGRLEFGVLIRAAYSAGLRDHPTALLYARHDIAELATVHPYPNGGVLRDSGLVVLRQPGTELEAQLYCGPHGGAHGHLDKLSLHLPGFTPDFGTPPYAMPQHKGWYQATLSHNTLVLDGLSQQPGEGKLLHFEQRKGVSYAIAEANAVYPGAKLCRSVLLTDCYLLDVFWFERRPGTISGETESNPLAGFTDWVLHPLQLETDEQAECEPISECAFREYSYLKDLKKSLEGNSWMRQGPALTLSMLESPADGVLLEASAPGPADRPDQLIPMLLVRSAALSGHFVALYQLKSGKALSFEILAQPTKEKLALNLAQVGIWKDYISLEAHSPKWEWRREIA